MTRKVYVITEGESDVSTLKKNLSASAAEHATFLFGGGKYGAASLARSVLVTKEENVAFIVDSDTSSEQLIREQENLSRELLAQVAPKNRFKIFMMTPNMETVLKGNNAKEVIAELAEYLEAAR